MSGPADNTERCSVCGRGLQVIGCKPGLCAAVSILGEAQRIVPASVVPIPRLPQDAYLPLRSVTSPAQPGPGEPIGPAGSTEEPTYTIEQGPIEVRGDPRAWAAFAGAPPPGYAKCPKSGCPRWMGPGRVWKGQPDKGSCWTCLELGFTADQGLEPDWTPPVALDEVPPTRIARVDGHVSISYRGGPWVPDYQAALAPELEALVRLMTDDAPVTIGTCHRTAAYGFCDCPVHRARRAVAKLDAAKKAGRDG